MKNKKDIPHKIGIPCKQGPLGTRCFQCNALVIAAPALLEALKELREEVIRHNQEYFQKQTDRHMVGGMAIHKADTAISQAEAK